MNKEREVEERGGKRIQRYLETLKEYYPFFATVTATTVVGVGALLLYLRRRTKEKREIDGIIERVLTEPEEVETIIQKLDEVAIIPIAERLVEEIETLDKEKKEKIRGAISEAAQLLDVPHGAVTLEDQIISISTQIAEDIRELRKSPPA